MVVLERNERPRTVWALFSFTQSDSAMSDFATNCYEFFLSCR